MHGIVFASLHDFLRERGGTAALEQVFGDRVFAMSRAHPDASFAELLDRAGDHLGVPTEELSGELGVFTGEQTFPRLYPAFYELADGTLGFLLGVETRIHELVRATVPEAEPPALFVRPVGEGSLEIDYSSPRRLCRLLEGLVLGTARHYGEQVAIAETACVRRGDSICRFRVEAKG